MAFWAVTKAPIIIAGGGIAGLSTALALAASGREALVLERAEQFTDIGAGLQLGPNAVHALKALGAWEEVAPITSQPQGLLLRDAVSGRVFKRIALSPEFERRFAAPYRVAHRADLHRALLRCVLRNGRVTLLAGHDVEQVTDRQSEVAVATKCGKTFQGEWLVAADGIDSSLRQKFWPGTAPADSGHVMHRALLPLENFSADKDIASVNLWMGPDMHVVHYPVGHPQKLNLVAVTASDKTIDDFRGKLAPELQTLLDAATETTKWPGLFVVPLRNWTQGRISLIGDAAHGTLPYLAQGAAMALEDAACLRAALETHGSTSDAMGGVSGRIARARRLHRRSLLNGRLFHLDGFAASLRNLALSRLPQGLFLSGLRWLYDYAETA